MASARFFARPRRVFFPERGVALPVVFVFHRPVLPDRLTQLGRTAFLSFQAGDEVAGLAFKFAAFVFLPFSDDPHKLLGSGKAADLFVKINSGNAAALNAPVFFLPVADPFVGDLFAEQLLRSPMERGLVVF